MALSLADLLEVPVVASARPEVVAGSRLESRPVRWIHTSEIYDISPLLRGGEVLLTTGLGLVGASERAQAAYIRSLAERGVTGLMLELGRTFPTSPQALVTAAREADFPLVLLHGVVPFIQITETVHPMLLDAELRSLRRSEQLTRELHTALLAGAGAAELLALAASHCEGPARIRDSDGRTLMRSPGADDDAFRGPVVTAELAGDEAMRLELGAEPDEQHRRLVQTCAAILAIAMGEEHSRAGRGVTSGAELVRDLAAGRVGSAARITARATALGVEPGPGEHVLGLVVHVTTHTAGSSGLGATSEALRRTFGRSILAEVEGDVVAAAVLRSGQLRPKLADLAAAAEEELTATVGGRLVRITAGPLVADAAGLARSVPAAREAARLADRLAIGSRVVLANDLGVYHLLSSLVDDPELERFVVDQLGPLLEIDASTGSELVATLDAYLEAGLSKTAAAAALGIRRQTLYARLDRIGRALGDLDLTDRQRRTALDLALVSWRLRTTASAGRGTIRSG